MIRRTLPTQALAAAALLCLFFSLSFAQVHIREKITIAPSPPVQPQALGGDGTTSLRVVYSVTRPIALRLFVTRECGGPVNNDLPFEGTGEVVFDTSHARIGGYYFNAQTRVAEIPVGDTVTARFKLYTGGALAYSSEIVYTGGGTEVFAVWIPKDQFYPYAFGFSMFPLTSCVRSGERSTIALPVSAFCSQNILWSPERDTITFRITQGGGLGELQNRSGQSLGPEARLKWDDALNMRFAAAPGLVQGGTVQIEAVAGDVTRTTSLNVYTEDEYALLLETFESEVQHGEQLELVGRAVACGGTNVIPPEGTTYTFRITQGKEWGRLYHEESQAVGDSLAEIPQLNGVARVWFQAWEDSPIEPQIVIVELSAEGKAPVTVTFQVIPGGLQITASPPILRYSEKSTITVLKLLPDGTTEPLVPEATVTYRVVSGNEAGTLQNPDSTEWGDELVYPSGAPVLFSALEEAPQPDAVEVVIQIEVNEGGVIIGKANNGRLPLLQIAATAGNPSVFVRSTASSVFFLGPTGTLRILVRRGIEKFCQGDWPTARYDNYVRKGKNGKDSLDAQGNKVYHAVASKGCALTGMAMIAKAGGADVNPGILAEYMNDQTHYGFQGTSVLWGILNDLPGNDGYAYDRYFGDGLQYTEDQKVDLTNSTTLSLADMDQYIGNGALIMAQVYNPTTTNNHWVVVTGKDAIEYPIVDPGCYEERTTLQNGYDGKIYKFVVFRKKANQS